MPESSPEPSLRRFGPWQVTLMLFLIAVITVVLIPVFAPRVYGDVQHEIIR